MPAAPIPNSAGFAQPDNAQMPVTMAGAGGTGTKTKGAGGGGGAALRGQNAGMGGPSGGGQIIISRAEAAALTVFETEEDSVQAYKRASEESGLSHSQVQRLKARADSARNKGFSLRGGNIMLQPHQSGATDERGLVWHSKKEKAEEDARHEVEHRHETRKERMTALKAQQGRKRDKIEEEVDREVAKVKKRAAKEALED